MYKIIKNVSGIYYEHVAKLCGVWSGVVVELLVLEVYTIAVPTCVSGWRSNGVTY